MARHESDREDLMREATALVRRVELDVPGEPEPVVCGFHADGRLSVYFGPDPVYHFDPEGRLRRAFADGHLFRTQGTTLARLTRVRSTQATELQRRDLDREELARFLERLSSRLNSLRTALGNAEARVLRHVPDEDAAPLVQLGEAIRTILHAGPALAPAIRGKR